MTKTDAPSQTMQGIEPKAERFNRDRIVVLGRRSSGKTVYLSMLYDILWKSNCGIAITALNGSVHTELMKTALDLREGRWPAATQNSTQSFVEINYRGQKDLMVILDYPGELLTDALVKQIETEETKTLLDHLDRAKAIMLLVDPAHVVGSDIEATIDNDYGIYQAVNRIRNWPGGQEVPTVLVLTKADETRRILKQHGGTTSFVKKFFPKLVSESKRLTLCKVAAVEVVTDKTGKKIPKKGFMPQNLVKPLLYCLDVIKDKEEIEKESRKQEEYLRLLSRLNSKERTRNILILLALFLIFLGLLALVISIFPKSIWKNIIYNLS